MRSDGVTSGRGFGQSECLTRAPGGRSENHTAAIKIAMTKSNSTGLSNMTFSFIDGQRIAAANRTGRCNAHLIYRLPSRVILSSGVSGTME
jgi:hypothetical protein